MSELILLHLRLDSMSMVISQYDEMQEGLSIHGMGETQVGDGEPPTFHDMLDLSQQGTIN